MLATLWRWLGGEVYGAFLPLHSHQGAKDYLVDLWRTAPRRVALSHSLLCLIVCGLPPVILFTPKLLPSLSAAEKERFVNRLLRSSFYWFRVIGYGVKSHALVAQLRYPAARAELKVSGAPAGERATA